MMGLIRFESRLWRVKDTNRPQLKAALDYLRDGDVLAVHAMDRLARNLDDLRKMVSDLTTRGIAVECVTEGLTFSNDDNAMSKLLLSVMGAFSEFERALVLRICCHPDPSQSTPCLRQDRRRQQRRGSR